MRDCSPQHACLEVVPVSRKRALFALTERPNTLATTAEGQVTNLFTFDLLALAYNET